MGREFLASRLITGFLPWAGDLHFYDDMAGPLMWSKAGTAGDSVLEKSQAYVFMGDYSLHLKSRVTGAAQYDTIVAYRELYGPLSKALSLTFAFLFPSAASLTKLQFQVKWWDGALLHTAVLFWDKSKWTYLDSGGSEADVPGGGQSLAQLAWHRFKLEINMVKKEYVFLSCDSLGVDLSGNSYKTEANSAEERLQLWLQAMASASPPVELYTDQLFTLQG